MIFLKRLLVGISVMAFISIVFVAAIYGIVWGVLLIGKYADYREVFLGTVVGGIWLYAAYCVGESWVK